MKDTMNRIVCKYVAGRKVVRIRFSTRNLYGNYFCSQTSTVLYENNMEHLFSASDVYGISLLSDTAVYL